MKALIQRVKEASVSVDGETVGSIGQGLLVFLGVARGDTEAEAASLVEKVVNLRIFSDDGGRFNLSIKDIGGEFLVVSQFTLLADTRRGRRPSFTDAAPPEVARPLVDRFTDMLSQTGLRVATGQFGAYMQVALHNDGPVTLMLDSAV
ncbi:MAG: D-tyrosyl-tRNA(Tyr) deacylase [Dehalococcoidia bacterium]|nr:D-tyrosyl-tRNA(Tyr) deacylase [Dehalococcoidia bacterium]